MNPFELFFSPFFMTIFLVIVVGGLLVKFIGKSSSNKNLPEPKSFIESEPITQTYTPDKNTLFCYGCGKPYQVSESKKFCDSCGVSLTKISTEETAKITRTQPTVTNSKRGVLTIIFNGCSTSFFPTEIFVNNVFRFREPTIKGFSVDIPLTNEEMIIETHETSTAGRTKFKLTDLDISKNYTMTLKFNWFMHEYNPKYELTETK